MKRDQQPSPPQRISEQRVVASTAPQPQPSRPPSGILPPPTPIDLSTGIPMRSGYNPVSGIGAPRAAASETVTPTPSTPPGMQSAASAPPLGPISGTRVEITPMRIKGGSDIEKRAVDPLAAQSLNELRRRAGG
jgi:hypothetical protein